MKSEWSVTKYKQKFQSKQPWKKLQMVYLQEFYLKVGL